MVNKLSFPAGTLKIDRRQKHGAIRLIRGQNLQQAEVGQIT